MQDAEVRLSSSNKQRTALQRELQAITQQLAEATAQLRGRELEAAALRKHAAHSCPPQPEFKKSAAVLPCVRHPSDDLTQKISAVWPEHPQKRRAVQPKPSASSVRASAPAALFPAKVRPAASKMHAHGIKPQTYAALPAFRQVAAAYRAVLAEHTEDQISRRVSKCLGRSTVETDPKRVDQIMQASMNAVW
jgi:hypothetical protein